MVSDLQARLDAEFPPPVLLSDGESFIGRYERLELGHADYRGNVWVLILTDRDGAEHSPWLLHQALVNGLKRLKPKPGEMVRVKRLGARRSQAGSSYVDWRCAVDRTASWDDVSPEDADP